MTAIYNPFVTARSRDKISSPMQKLVDLKLLHGRILDFGAGFGSDVKLLRKFDFDIVAYDKYNKQLSKSELLEQKYDMVTCHYVFNVIALWDEFNRTLNLLKTLSDNVYISVRTDKKAVKENWIYDEELEGYWTSKSFQRFYNINDVYRQFGKVDVIKAGNSYILFKLEG